MTLSDVHRSMTVDASPHLANANYQLTECGQNKSVLQDIAPQNRYIPLSDSRHDEGTGQLAKIVSLHRTVSAGYRY